MAVILMATKRMKRMQVFNLDNRAMMKHATRKKIQVMEPHRDGGLFPKLVSKRIPASLTVPAGIKVSKFSNGQNLTDDIVDVPCIAAAIKRRELRAIKWDPSRPEKKKSSRNVTVPGTTKAAAAKLSKKTDKK